MPRAKVHNPLNPAQAKTVHMLGFPGLWNGKRVTPKVETTVVIEGVRFKLDDTGKAALLEGDEKSAKFALDLIRYMD